MTNNLIPYAPILCAAGAKLNFNSSDQTVNVVEYPKNRKKVVDDAILDISNFLNTKTPEDTLNFFGFVDYIDGQENPLNIKTRNNIKDASGLMRDGKFILQELSNLKVNKSWHTSEVANQCSYFNTLCTNRGVEQVEGKRGRKAT